MVRKLHIVEAAAQIRPFDAYPVPMIFDVEWVASIFPRQLSRSLCIIQNTSDLKTAVPQLVYCNCSFAHCWILSHPQQVHLITPACIHSCWRISKEMLAVFVHISCSKPRHCASFPGSTVHRPEFSAHFEIELWFAQNGQQEDWDELHVLKLFRNNFGRHSYAK